MLLPGGMHWAQRLERRDLPSFPSLGHGQVDSMLERPKRQPAHDLLGTLDTGAAPPPAPSLESQTLTYGGTSGNSSEARRDHQWTRPAAEPA